MPAQSPDASLYPPKSALEAAFKVAHKAKIPQMPDVVAALREEVSKPDPDVAKACRLIEKDPAMTGQLLKTANSPAFGLGAKITNVQQAATLIGLNRLTNIVTAEAVSRLMPEQAGTARVVWDGLMEEAKLISTVAHVVPGISADEAYLFGVMHDVGALIFASVSPEYGAAWTLNSHCSPRQLFEHEKSTLGIDHATVGFLLAGHWQLPDYVALAIAHHHSPGPLSARNPKINYLIALSKLAHYLGAHTHGTEDTDEMTSYREDAWKQLDISEHDWALLREGTSGAAESA